MPQYLRNTGCDVEFLSNQGVWEYLEDELSKLPPKLLENDGTRLLFECLRFKLTLDDMKRYTKSVDWATMPFEIQAIAVGLKLFRRN